MDKFNRMMVHELILFLLITQYIKCFFFIIPITDVQLGTDIGAQRLGEYYNNIPGTTN